VAGLNNSSSDISSPFIKSIVTVLFDFFALVETVEVGVDTDCSGFNNFSLVSILKLLLLFCSNRV